MIILTSGLTGSSVFAGLLAQDGYWIGSSTIKKPDYDTWENAELVRLNTQILRDAQFSENWTMRYEDWYIDHIMRQHDRIIDGEYSAFIQQCNDHSPWLWKDPRLWLTIRYWRRFLDLDTIYFLLIRREPMQSWISITLRRQIQSQPYAQQYEQKIYESIMRFVEQAHGKYFEILYEDLLLNPVYTVEAINQKIGSTLTMTDFCHVFRGKMFRKQHGTLDLLRAWAIYLKNYPERFY